ncbi:DUF1028 domain-containing protein [Micromonospora yangpuensis]|uniref:Uncharacterized conserved protein, Ntn-hydrolase superfamily n=1 Tax=Micromonospora yangpuensis TaxID=683228 RepID=A0A1C6UPW6_9ACTN|nr:DUF1028 domain-containing protein [Micromonospora yangpuensis]GGM08049.1 pilus assembly protein [Micromonospora yangpuensis]SCL56085.1 Uncharacterized conserved protein, Ntn-hydrolase superfamily [Micromonospora yangpuensis]
MTFSIVARCPRTGQLGVAALTATAGVGKLLSHVRNGAGAVATQATHNPFLAYDGLPMLAEGRSPREVFDELLANDPGRDVRQAGVVDAQGRSHAFTGARTLPWSGQHVGSGFAAQGNRLAGPETLAAIVRGYQQDPEADLVERLLCAIEAGEDSGGDRKGAGSATITVISEEPYPLWDLRVDDADDPARELRRLYGVFQEQMLPIVRGLPTRDDPMGESARQVLAGGTAGA